MHILRRVERQAAARKTQSILYSQHRGIQIIQVLQRPPTHQESISASNSDFQFTTPVNSELTWIDSTLAIFFGHGHSFVANLISRYRSTGVEWASLALLLLLCYPSFSRFFLNDKWDCVLEFLFEALLTRWLQVKWRKHLWQIGALV